MIDLNNPNLQIFAAALVFGLLLVWYLFGRASTPRERSYKPDVLDEGAAPAARSASRVRPPAGASPGGRVRTAGMGAAEGSRWWS